VGTDRDWNDYLEPEVDGPEIYSVYSCPKCGDREVIPDGGYQANAGAPTVMCPKCKTKMHEDTEL
jgi:DNA polymerase III alpha subunit (gram-positive type)